jgi:hypothetical protein
MYIDKSTLVVCIIVAAVVIEWLRHKAYQHGRLAGVIEAVQDVSRSCSYQRENGPLPEGVDKALVYMNDSLKRGKGVTGRITLYLTGAGMLGNVMGEAAYGRGLEAGRLWLEPSDGETRIDMTAQEIRTLAWLADVGFHHVIDGSHVSNFRDAADAEAASNAVHTLEGHAPPIEGIDTDPYEDCAWYRQTSIWDKWPNERG